MEGGSADFFSTVRDLMHQPGLAVQMLDLETKVSNLDVVANQALQDVLSYIVSLVCPILGSLSAILGRVVALDQGCMLLQIPQAIHPAPTVLTQPGAVTGLYFGSAPSGLSRDTSRHPRIIADW